MFTGRAGRDGRDDGAGVAVVAGRAGEGEVAGAVSVRAVRPVRAGDAGALATQGLVGAAVALNLGALVAGAVVPGLALVGDRSRGHLAARAGVALQHRKGKARSQRREAVKTAHKRPKRHHVGVDLTGSDRDQRDDMWVG